MPDETAFEHAAGFEHAATAGNVKLGTLELMYEELFAEVIEDGIITAEERSRLDRAAESMGLDRERLRRLEQALVASWEARNAVVVREMYESEKDKEGPRASIEPLVPATDARTLSLQRRVRDLEARIADLEKQLEEARAMASVEVDLSDAGARDVPDDDPAELQRRLRHDPRDDAALRSLYRIWEKRGDADRRWCAAQALVWRDVADREERAFFDAHRPAALVRPKTALTSEAWERLLAHPEQETTASAIFAVVAPAVLLGRVSALRRDKKLPALDPAKKQDPATSTVQAVRCFAWAAATLGMTPPPLYVDPDYPGTAELVPAMPPVVRLGAKALAGRSATELAFIAGQQMAWHRAEHVVRLLVPSIQDLEEVFLAALSIGNPGLPMNEKMRALVVPIAKAIEPILEPAVIDRLRGHFLRFVEEGGRTNLQRWATAVDRTAARAGLLLANDLRAAHAVIALDGASPASPGRGRNLNDEAHAGEKMDDLVSFVASDRYARLRRQIGVAIESEG
jgi:hypothetical protein